jgi:hypothetical protein
MDSNTDIGVERPSDLTIGGEVCDGICRRAFKTRSAVAACANEMNRSCEQTSEAGLAVSLVRW